MADQLDEAIASFQRCIEARDRETAEDVLHLEYALVLVQPTKPVMSRTRWLELLPGYVVHSYTVEERVIDVDGDVAVVIHRAEMQATVLGQDRSTACSSSMISGVVPRASGRSGGDTRPRFVLDPCRAPGSG